MNQAAETLRQYLIKDSKGRQALFIPEGKFKGWVPRTIYELPCVDICLPFLKLMSFPIGGTSLGQLTDMESFNAVGNYLARLPESFGQCQNLVKLNISFNHFETIPSAIFQLSNLTELDCSDNDLVDIGTGIGELKKLRVLNVSGNLLDDLPAELAQCEKLQRLDLSRKWYPSGGFKVLPEAVCYLRDLSHLDVSWHQIHTIPAEVRNMSHLHTLRMRGNFLKHVSEGIAECRKLQYLDLTGAMKLNSVIPPEIFTLSELKILDLTNNYFTELSSDIIGLKKLKKFVMRRNALLRLPEEIFRLDSLESLDVSENYLIEIPSTVKELKTLKHLYLACNNIEKLPPEICFCRNLTELHLHRNKLTELPAKFHKLTNLEELMLEGNELKQLPLLMDKLKKLRETERLSVHNNRLERPPQAVANQGVATIYAFLKELRICEASHRKKLILIGASKAGKTSLRNVLLLGKSKLTAEHERTWVMEQHLWEPEPELRVQILDFGGHHIYSAAHHMFLTPEALHLLVFDISSYKAELYDSLIGDWIDSIGDRAPGATIMVVGTHADLCWPEAIEKAKAHALKCMHEEERSKIQDLDAVLRFEQEKIKKAVKESGEKFPDLVTQRMQDRVQKMLKLRNTRVKLPDEIFVVSCTDRLTGVINFHENLIDSLKAGPTNPLPELWHRFLQNLQERKEKILRWEDAMDIFQDLVKNLQQSMYRYQGSVEQSLETVLQYFHCTGEIVWYYENKKLRDIVFHHPETLVEMLRVIFRHDFDEVVIFRESYGQITELSQSQFESLKKQFMTHGLVTDKLLHYCLLHFNISLDAQDTFIDLMLKFDLCYEVKDTHSAPELVGSNRILQFPWFLTSSPPQDLSSKWPEKAPVNTIELRFQLQFLKKGLPNFFEKISARLQSYVTYRQDWKNGIYATRNKTKLLLTRKRNSGLVCVTVSVRGADLQELWFLILTLRADMSNLLQEWPFVKVDAYLLCSHCLAVGIEKPYLWRGEVLDVKNPKGLYHLQCPNTEPDVLIPACLVYPIDPDYPDEEIGKHITIVTEFLSSIYDTVDSPGLLSDLLLSNVAAQLGIEWHAVALALGHTEASIQQIQIDNMGFVHRQITSALIKWRDRSQTADLDKVEELLKAISNSGRADLAYDLREKYCGQGPVRGAAGEGDN